MNPFRYCFGGIFSDPKEDFGGLMIRHVLMSMDDRFQSADDHRSCLDTFCVYDMEQGSWSYLGDGQTHAGDVTKWPSKRGFANMVIHDGAVYLCGGRLNWESNLGASMLSDMWKYDIETSKWTQIDDGVVGPRAGGGTNSSKKGQRGKRTLPKKARRAAASAAALVGSGKNGATTKGSASCVHNGSWFTLDTNPNRLHRGSVLWQYNFAKNSGWVVVPCNDPPAFAMHAATGWLEGDRFYIWNYDLEAHSAGDVGDYPGSRRLQHSYIAVIDLSQVPCAPRWKAPTWGKVYLGVGGGVDGSLLQTAKESMRNGTFGDVLNGNGIGACETSEASSCYDPFTKKAYVFGGWNYDYVRPAWMNNKGTKHSGGGANLFGRYYGHVLEIDMKNLIVRVVESAPTGEGEALGPTPRGFASIAVHTSFTPVDDDDEDAEEEEAAEVVPPPAAAVAEEERTLTLGEQCTRTLAVGDLVLTHGASTLSSL